MQNLSFDDGYKEFKLFNDPNRIIRFNPSDFGIMERISEAYEMIDKAAKKVGDIELKADGGPMSELNEIANKVKEYDKSVKDAINYVFNSDISTAAFGKQSPLSFVTGGKYLWESFLECIMKVVKTEIEAGQKASRNRITKYTSQVK